MPAHTVGTGLTIRMLDEPAELAAINALFQQIWGSSEPVVQVDLLRAIAYAGGYVAGVYDADAHLIGASFGFLGRHAGAIALHSHVTGILPGLQQSGVGRALKEHQRVWAAARDIAWITWTFDPLVRRNAHFNVSVLGAHVAAYLVDFYGPMHDAVNTDVASDRLLAAWPTDPAAGAPVAPAGATVTVATPDDIVVVRRTDPAAADAWRMRVRAELGDRMATGAVVTGFTRAGEYVLTVPE